MPPLPRYEGPLDLELIAIDQDQKPKSLHVRYAVDRTNVALGEIVVTTNARGVGDAVKDLLHLVEDAGDSLDANTKRGLRAWARQLWSTATLTQDAARVKLRAELVSAASDGDIRDMIEIATEYMREYLQLAFIGTRGHVWSEAFGRSVDFVEFSRCSGTGLLKALWRASDFAPPDKSNPTRHVRNAEKLMRTVWGDLIKELPSERDSKLGPESRAARAVRAKMSDLLHAPGIGIITEGRQRLMVSLVARAHSLCNLGSDASRGWTRLAPGVDAWFRLTEVEGCSAAWIAVRPLLFRNQIARHSIASLGDERGMATLLDSYGLAACAGVPDNRVPLEGGRRRRAFVLSRSFTDEILFGMKDNELSSASDGGDWTEAGSNADV